MESSWYGYGCSKESLKNEAREMELSSEGSKSELSFRIIGNKISREISKNEKDVVLLCYNDRHGWGKEIIRTIREIENIQCRLIGADEEIPDSPDHMLYIHPDHLNNREKDRALIERIQGHLRTGFMPSKIELLIYDEKVRQAELFSGWMPETRIFEDPGAALDHLEGASFPIISLLCRPLIII